jgi:hypothetical protein
LWHRLPLTLLLLCQLLLRRLRLLLLNLILGVL